MEKHSGRIDGVISTPDRRIVQIVLDIDLNPLVNDDSGSSFAPGLGISGR